MKLLLLRLLVVTLPALAAAQSIPRFPSEFRATIEVNDLLKHESTEWNVAWDQAGQRARFVETGPGGVAQHDEAVYNFALEEFYSISQGACESATEPPASAVHLGGSGALRAADDYFDVHADAAYAGRHVARGIDCDRWDFRVVNATLGHNYTVEWYFTAPSWTFRTSEAEARVPARQVIDGLAHGSPVRHQREWVDFLPGTPPDEEFAAPREPVLCAAPRPREVTGIPQDDYFVIEEVIDLEDRTARAFRQWYDFSNNRMRFELDEGAEGTDAGDAFTMIVLGAEDALYLRKGGECQRFQPIPAWAAGLGYNVSARHLTHPAPFDVHAGRTTSERVYVGVDTVRGVQVHRWRATTEGRLDDGTGFLQFTEDYYAATDEWSVGGAVGAGVPVGTRVSGYYVEDRHPPKPFSQQSSYVAGYLGAIPAHHFRVNGSCPAEAVSNGFPLRAPASVQQDPEEKEVSAGLAAGLAILFLLVGTALGWVGARCCCYRGSPVMGGRRRRAAGATEGVEDGAGTAHIELE